MGSINHSKRIQTRVSKFASFFGETPVNVKNHDILISEVKSLLEKAAIEPVIFRIVTKVFTVPSF